MAHGLHHIGITVSDMDAALGFYSELTGGKITGPFVKSESAVDQATGYPGVEVHLAFVPQPPAPRLQLTARSRAFVTCI